MMRLALTILIIALSGSLATASQSPSKTYQDTRKLYPERLAALFRVGDARINDLIQALDDPNKEISLHAQIVIRYLGNETGLKGLAEYYKKPREEYSWAGPIPIPIIEADYQILNDYINKPVENLYLLKDAYIYALALDNSARAKELLASIFAANGDLSANTFISRALISVKSNDPNKLLKGGKDLAKVVLENAFFVGKFDKEYASSGLVGFNGAKDKAVVEVYINRGPLSTEKYHVVISKHENGWKFYSITQTSIS